MKFTNYLESIAGVGIFPIITLLVFFLVFTILAIWAVKAKKNYISAMNNLPFEDCHIEEVSPKQ